MILVPQPLQAERFAPFGDVLEAPPEPGRRFFGQGLVNRRPRATLSLAVAHASPLAALPLVATRMERHEFSSQSFLALDVERWLVIVAPKTNAGGPDVERAQAFFAGPGQGVTYHADTWHHPLTVLDRPARFAVLIWLENSKTDEEFQATLGERPVGWYCRYGPSVNTRRLIVEEGGFLYDSDYYGDELPFWKTVAGKPHLIVPYSLTNNDGKFTGWIGAADDWFAFVRDAFDMLYREGATHPKMMSVGLHMRLIGHPARAVGLERLLDYMMQRREVWITRRLDIAQHWVATHPYPGKGLNE